MGKLGKFLKKLNYIPQIIGISEKMDSSRMAQKKTGLNENEWLKLNIGGHLFQTTVATLLSQDGMLKRMCESDLEAKKNHEGYVFIDRNGEYFSEILNFLVRGQITSSRPIRELFEILAEAEFYQIEPLILMLKEKIAPSVGEKYSNQDMIILIDNMDGALEIIRRASKPVLYLGIIKECHERILLDGTGLFRQAYEIHKGAFQFILHLDAPRESESNRTWIIYQDGKNLIVTKHMEMDLKNNIVQIFAQSAQKSEATEVRLFNLHPS